MTPLRIRKIIRRKTQAVAWLQLYYAAPARSALGCLAHMGFVYTLDRALANDTPTAVIRRDVDSFFS